MKKTETILDWVKKRKSLFSSNKKVEKKPVKTSVSAIKKIAGYEVKERPNKERAKGRYIEVLKNSWAKIKKTGVETGLIASLAHLFETESKIVEDKTLNGIEFIAYEYRNVGLAEFVKKQRQVLNKNKKLAERVIDICQNKFETMVRTAVENQYIAIDGDYCGELLTFFPEIEMALDKKIVCKNGIMCFTFKKNSRKVRGIDATRQMKGLINRYSNYRFVPMFGGSDFFEYNDSETGKGQNMVCCIIERVK